MNKVFKIIAASSVIFFIIIGTPKISEIVKASSQYQDDLR